MSKWCYNTTGASTDYWDTWTTSNTSASTNDCLRVQEAGTACQKLFTYFETTNQQMFEPIYIMSQAANLWLDSHQHELIHDPWKYIYVPGQDIEEILGQQNEQLTDVQRKAFATQHLAPICEALEIEGYKRVMDHLEKLLNDEAYRMFQLTEINKINKILGLKECIWDVQAVRDKIGEIKGQHTPRKIWAAKGWAFIHKQAEKRAEELFNDVFTPEEVLKLNTDKRLLISRGDLAFELTADGGINQLLPDGQKQGWCLVSKEYGLALKDVLVMKKLILESAPEIVLQIAHKTSIFN
jgi:hypothetical protein